MRGASAAFGLRMCTHPRLVGLRLHTLAVKASKPCSGSPKASRLSGCTWYSMFAYGCSGVLRVKAPSCDGAMLIGPLRVSRYCRPMPALPHQVAAMRLSVFVPRTL